MSCILGVKDLRSQGKLILYLTCFYADDLIIFFKVTSYSYEFLNELLTNFGIASRLQINKTELEVSFNPNTPQNFKKFNASMFRIKSIPKLRKYLDSFLNGTNYIQRARKEILQNFHNKL